MIEARARDFRLDVHIRSECASDIESLCGHEKDNSKETANQDGKVIHCLQDLRDELSSTGCQQAVHAAIQRASQDVRFSSTLADECYEDRQQHCANVQPVRSAQAAALSTAPAASRSASLTCAGGAGLCSGNPVPARRAPERRAQVHVPGGAL